MQNDPWGRRESQIDEELNKLLNRFRGLKLPGNAMGGVVVALLVLWAAATSFYKVGTEETGVVLRFGRFVQMTDPGLRVKLPFGIEDVYLVKTGRVLREDFGFRTVDQGGGRSTYVKRGLEEESLTLTGDLNVTDVEWIVQYQIADPYKYLFKVNNPASTIRDIAEAVVRRVVGNSNVTEVLTTERALLALAIQKDVQEILNSYEMGVRIVTVRFQDVNPPGPVKAAFNEVNEAEQQKESMILQAHEQYNREVPMARGVARSRILEAEGYAVERVNRAQGEALRFSALLGEYRKAPEVTRRRLYLETLESILPQVEEIYVMDAAGATSALPLLPLRQAGKGGAQ
ncbi:FtsH protease activity modulator HflK [Geoalkalibacter sp.]|uniref:FtsH protease activity modulator HflK n=1 Tax=Geoalkalibacter sp. TaxID=3041440 RepID=UPI00272DEE15|nr:FtsH protease activity modulator HflK [Geoalkalibacter sp.]